MITMRHVNSLKGLRVLRTMQSRKRRSIPRIQASPYLDLYIFNNEKERLLKEAERLALRNTVITKRLEEIDLEINKLQKAEAIVKANGNLSSLDGNFTQKDGVKKEWKKMPLNY